MFMYGVLKGIAKPKFLTRWSLSPPAPHPTYNSKSNRKGHEIHHMKVAILEKIHTSDKEMRGNQCI